MNALEELKQVVIKAKKRDFRSGAEFRRAIDKCINRIESEWIELPRDKDGEVIHIGDTVRYLDDKDVFKVYGITFNSDGERVIESADGVWSRPNSISHVNPDTWERIEADAMLYPFEYLHKLHIPTDPVFTEIGQQKIDLVRRCKALAGVSE